MSSLRAVVNIGPKSWARLSRIVTGVADDCYSSISTFQSRRTFTFTSQICDKKVETDNTSEKASTTASSSTSAAQSMGQDNVDVLLKPISTNIKENQVRTFEYKLMAWGKITKELQNQGKPVPLKAIVSNSFSDVLSFSLTPCSPPDMRHKCLALLLSQPTDDARAQMMLKKTEEDAMQLSIKVLADIVHSLTVSSPTPLRKLVRSSLVATVVEKRWYEVGPRHVLFFMYQLDDLFNVKEISAEFRAKSREKKAEKERAPESITTSDSSSQSQPQVDESGADVGSVEKPGKEMAPKDDPTSRGYPFMNANLETRVISLMNELKIKDLARVIILQAKWRNRNQTLLNAVLHRLSQADLSEFTFTQLCNLLVSSSFLNIQDTDFLEKLTHQLSLCDLPTTSQACAILVSLSHLRWSAPNLASKCVSYLASHIDQISPRDAGQILMSLAILYCLPCGEEEEQFIEDLTQKSQSVENQSLREKINVVWCLAILKSLTVNWLSALFKSNLKAQTDLFKDDVTIYRKLMDVDRAARLELSGYDGPWLANDLDSSQTQTTVNESDSTQGLFEALKKFVDLATYVDISHDLPFIDAVMEANSEGEVRALKGQNDTQAPHRLAIQYVPYNGTIHPVEKPIGSYQMAERHLKLMGYVPVQIPYSDLLPSLSVLEQINNIKKRFKQAVINSSSLSSSSTPLTSLSSPTGTASSADS